MPQRRALLRGWFHDAFLGFQGGGRVAREHVPDLDQELAGQGCDGDIAVAFSGKEFPAPLAQGRGAAHAKRPELLG